MKGSDGPGPPPACLPRPPGVPASQLQGRGGLHFPESKNTRREERAATRPAARASEWVFQPRHCPQHGPTHLCCPASEMLRSFLGLCWYLLTFYLSSEVERCLHTLPRCPAGKITPSPLTPSFQARTAELSDRKVIRMEKKTEKIRRKVFPGRKFPGTM